MTIDVTTGARGGPFTGVTIVTPPNPQTGVATVRGLTVVFAPAVTFTGTVTFTFALSNAFGTSAPATITINVNGRPDPSKEADVNSLVTAMTDAIERFVQTQSDNFKARLDMLHGGGSGGTTLTGLTFTVNGRSLATLSDDSVRSLLARTYGRINETTAVPPAAGAGPPVTSRLGIWADGNFELGAHGGIPSRSGLSFGTSGVSAGADYRFTDRLALGVGIGFARDANDLVSGHDQGTRETAQDIAMYGSLRLGDRGFFDALLGVGTARIETRRFDPIGSTLLRGARDANDRFASVKLGQEFVLGGWRVAPYGGLDATAATLRSYTEKGGPPGALTYADQPLGEVAAVAGFRADARFPTKLGEVSPHVALQYGRRLSATSVGRIWYADRPETVFAIPANQIGSSPLGLTLGGTLRLDQGFLFTVDYQSIIDRDAVQHLLRIGLSTKL